MTEDFTPAIPDTAPIPQYVAPTPVAPQIPAGWHPHPTNAGLLRYWDGQAWTDHTAPAVQAHQPQVQQQQPQIVIQNSNSVGGHRTNHVLHFILTVLTAGLWLPVWIVIAVMNGSKRGQSGNTYYR